MVEMQRLAAEVQSLRAAAAAGGPTPEQKEKDKAKLGTPKPFNGHVGANVLTWLIGMESYLVGCNTPPNRWPLVASSYLEDSAREWFHSFFVSTNGVITWDTFKAGLLARFRPVDSNRVGRAQLMELKMKPSDRGRGVLQYVNRFLQLVNQVSDITENEKFTYFNQGLTPELQRLLIPLTHINNVNDAISMVVKFETTTTTCMDTRNSHATRTTDTGGADLTGGGSVSESSLSNFLPTHPAHHQRTYRWLQAAHMSTHPFPFHSIYSCHPTSDNIHDLCRRHARKYTECIAATDHRIIDRLRANACIISLRRGRQRRWHKQGLLTARLATVTHVGLGLRVAVHGAEAHTAGGGLRIEELQADHSGDAGH
jgi:hypothetical protein